MSNPLPGLLDRSFIVGYFLPALMFIAASLGLIAGLGQTLWLAPFLDKERIVLSTTIIVLASALGGVILLLINQKLIRLIEGYGKYNPARVLAFIERLRFKHINRTLSRLNEERDDFDSRDEVFPQKLRAARIRLTLKKAQRFPMSEEDLLPTAVGNTIRAFESYPVEIYGLDAIQGWSRLMAVIPQEYRELVFNAKARMDFWVNLWFLSLLYLLLSVGSVVYLSLWNLLWLPLVALVIAPFAAIGVRQAAAGWGTMIKASFDVFLPRLRAELELPFPADMDEERRQWNEFTRVILYRDRQSAISRAPSQQPINGAGLPPLSQIRARRNRLVRLFGLSKSSRNG